MFCCMLLWLVRFRTYPDSNCIANSLGNKMFFKIFVLCIVARGSFSKEAQLREGETDCVVNEDIYKQFATKTAYSMINGTLSKTDYEVTGCDPLTFWLLSRHGSVYPSKSIMEGFQDLETLLGVIKESSDVCETLQNWTLIENDMYEELSEKGSVELKELAERYSIGFKEFFDSAEFHYQHAEEKRTEQSFKKFAEGLSQENPTAEVVEGKQDMLLKFYESCEKWNENNKKQDETDSEASQFERSDKFNTTIASITRKLGLIETLKIEQVNKIWDMCRYEAWKNDELSPWCLAFTKDDIDVLEYREDLRSYYKAGHGAEINSRVACKPVVDMLTHLKSNESIPKVFAYFAHASTIQLFLTALQVRKDNDKLKANNFDDMQRREWRSSEISPFTSNLAVVRYNCTDGEYKVKFFLNEKPLKLEWCTGNTDDSCQLNQVIDQYSLYKDVDCANYYCSGETKILYEVFYIVLGSIFIYLY